MGRHYHLPSTVPADARLATLNDKPDRSLKRPSCPLMKPIETQRRPHFTSRSEDSSSHYLETRILD